MTGCTASYQWSVIDTRYRPEKTVAVLSGISDLQVRIWEPGQGWRQLTGNRKADPVGLETNLTCQTPQGEERYRQVIGPLQ